MASYGHAEVGAHGSAKPERRVVDADAVRAELGRVLADPLFGKSKRCTSLLKYVVEKSLAGAEDLKERTIGLELFGRAPGYDTNQDPTVRIAAAEVRKRLILHYSDTGSQQNLRIELPVHSYIAEFTLSEEKPVLLNASPAQEGKDGRRRNTRYWYLLAPLAVAVVGLIAWGTYRLLSPVSAVDKFWTPVLETPNQILLGVSSPSTTSPAPSQTSNPPGAPELSFRDFTKQHSADVAMSDVTAANGVASYLLTKKKVCNLGPANALTMWDLRASPVVMFGTFNSYWATKLGATLRFRFARESESGKRWIEDANSPGDRTWMLDMSAPTGQVDSDYALISRVFDQSTGQWWIGVAGLTGVGTLAAEQWMLDPKAMTQAISGFPKGWEAKNVQIVVGVNLVQGNPGVTRVLRTYVW